MLTVKLLSLLPVPVRNHSVMLPRQIQRCVLFTLLLESPGWKRDRNSFSVPGPFQLLLSGSYRKPPIVPKMEVPPGFEPGNKGFADLRLTAWLWHRIPGYHTPVGPAASTAFLFRFPRGCCLQIISGYCIILLMIFLVDGMCL